MSSAQDLLRAATDSGLMKAPLEAALLDEARRARRDPVELAAARLRMPREAFYRALAKQRGLPFVDVAELAPDADLLARAPARLLLRKAVLPLRTAGQAVLVATSDPDDATTLDALARALGRAVSPAIADPTALQTAVRRHVAATADAPAPTWDAVAALDDLMRQAWLRRASDLHLDAQEDGLRVRARVDGRLAPLGPTLPHEEAAQLVSRVKVLAGLDIAEKREPQDGGFTWRPGSPLGDERDEPSRLTRGAGDSRRPVTSDGEDRSATQRGADGDAIDVRVATIPCRFGERATLRLLGVETRRLTIENLGFAEADLGRLKDTLAHPHGILLLTGPTGSGKTTTLYAALRAVASPDLNVMTVEDPIEFVLPGIAQIQVDRAGKVTFASALRSLLRHDPDVLMVGEIRDHETAGMALQAAMTGHLVLSSLHTNRAVTAVARLVDLGCERFLVGSTLRGVIAQRLVRALCAGCRAPREASREELLRLTGAPHEPARVFDPTGCPACLGTGYAGRVAVSECLWMDEDLAGAVTRGVPEAELVALARARGARSLAEDGLRRVLSGETSLAEAMMARS